jgi:hypothetical protein
MHAHAGARKAIVIGRCSRVTQEKTLFLGQVITRKSPCGSYPETEFWEERQIGTDKSACGK